MVPAEGYALQRDPAVTRKFPQIIPGIITERFPCSPATSDKMQRPALFH